MYFPAVYPSADCSHFKAVSHAPDGLDVLRIRGIVFNFLTDLFDVYRYRRNISDAVHVPDLAEQLFLGKHMIRILRKEGQKIEFLRGKLLLLSVYPDTSGRFVNFQTTDFNNVIFRPTRSDKALILGKMCLYPRRYC